MPKDTSKNIAAFGKLRNENPGFSATQWNSLGCDYYNGANGREKNYTLAYRCFEQATKLDSKNLYAICNLGLFYEYGRDTKKDLKTAADYYKIALENGHASAEESLERLAKNGDYPAAYQILGSLYKNGHGVERDFKKAAKYYQQALEKGCTEAQGNLDGLRNQADISAADLNSIGEMYHQKDGAKSSVERSYTIAKQWYDKSLEKSEKTAAAYHNIAWLYEHGRGKGIWTNFFMAAKYYQQAIDVVDTRSIETKVGEDARAALKHLREHPDMSADELNRVGVIYHTGNGIIANPLIAKLWYEQAIQKGCAIAYRNLGKLYEDGLGVGKNLFKAARYYQQALEKGYKEAQEDLDKLRKSENIDADDLDKIGMMYQNADGVERSYTKAKLWYEQAKEKGSAAAYRHIAWLYEHGKGEGVWTNIPIAAEYYQQALERGDELSEEKLQALCEQADGDDLYKIGLMYFKGEKVAQNFLEAKEYFEKSAKKGSAKACKKLGFMYEDEAGQYGVAKDLLEATKYYQKGLENLGIDDLELPATVAIAAAGSILSLGLGTVAMVAFAMGMGLSHFQKLERSLKDGLNRLLEEKMNANEIYRMGNLYFKGEGVKQSYTLAKQWYDVTLTKEENAAIYKDLAWMYEHGKGGVSTDFVKAVEYYQKAVDVENSTTAEIKEAARAALKRLRNHAELSAQNLYEIGAMYCKDQAVDRKKKAKKWFEKAINENPKHAESHMELSLLYKNGARGINPDEHQSKRHEEYARKYGGFFRNSTVNINGNSNVVGSGVVIADSQFQNSNPHVETGDRVIGINQRGGQ